MRTSLLGFLGYREERNDWPLNQMALLSFIHTLFISAEFRRASAVWRAELHCRGSCVDYFFHPIISNGTVTIRELNSKLLLLLFFYISWFVILTKLRNICSVLLTRQDGTGYSVHICSMELNMTHAVENSVLTASVHCLTLSHFIFSGPHAVLLRFHLGILLKSVACLLKIYQVLLRVFSFFLPECANRVIKTAFVVLSSCSKPVLLSASHPYSSAFCSILTVQVLWP